MNILQKQWRIFMAIKERKISSKWIEQTRDYFREFLDETDFPDPDRLGERGPKFYYPDAVNPDF